MTFDPLVPRPIDLPTPIGGELDNAKIIAAPDDPADWPAWRDALAQWREEARAGYDGSAYERLEWTQSCFSVALVWLWDERLYDHEALDHHLYEAPGGVVQLYLRDPSGNLVECDYPDVANLDAGIAAQIRRWADLNDQSSWNASASVFDTGAA